MYNKGMSAKSVHSQAHAGHSMAWTLPLQGQGNQNSNVQQPQQSGQGVHVAPDYIPGNSPCSSYTHPCEVSSVVKLLGAALQKLTKANFMQAVQRSSIPLVVCSW